MKTKSKSKIYLYFVFLFIFSVFIRLYNLNTTARFTRDESSDLVSINRIINQKDITLIGPIAEGNSGIFSSLTYYISLPFVYFSKSDPIGPVIATSFYGLITIILIWVFLKKEKIKWLPMFLLPAIASPFIEMSRWAWNPHFIPLWQIIGLLFFISNIPYSALITGVLFGLTIHQHWYSVFSCIGFIFLIYMRNKKIKDIIQYITGLFITIIPFIIFDYTHPPGLFLSRMLYFSPVVSKSYNFIDVFTKFIQIPFQFIQYITYNNNFFSWTVLSLSTIIVIKNILAKKHLLNLFLFPIVFQFIGLAVISSPVANRYLIPCILFYIIWLSKNLKSIFSKIIILSIIICNLISLPKILYQNDWTNNINALKQITNLIKEDSKKTGNSFNLVVLQSPDGNTKGTRFRDLLKIQNINPLPPEDYQTPKTLFIISYGSWEKIKEDPAYEMSHFRKNSPDNYWQIDNSKWILYKVNK